MTLCLDFKDLAQRMTAFAIAFILAFSVGSMFCVGTSFSQEKGKEPLTANEAQKLMLLRDHLKKISKPTKLRYSFERKSQKKDDSFKDVIDVNITKVKKDGGKDISFDYFTGSRKRPYPDVADFRTNGLVMVSITRDIWQMAREIGKHAQQANYFGKRINVAIRKNPKVEEVTLDTDKGQIKSKKITVQPFVGDYHIEKFKMFEKKIYEFYFSEAIPGELYMVRTFIPAGEVEKDAGPQIEEITKFEEELPLQ